MHERTPSIWSSLHWLSPPADAEAERHAVEVGRAVCATPASIEDAYGAITDALEMEVLLTRTGAARGDLWGRLLIGREKGFVAIVDPDPSPAELAALSSLSDSHRNLAEKRIRFRRLGHEIAHVFFYNRKGRLPTRPPKWVDPAEERACDNFGWRLYAEIERLAYPVDTDRT